MYQLNNNFEGQAKWCRLKKQIFWYSKASFFWIFISKLFIIKKNVVKGQNI